MVTSNLTKIIQKNDLYDVYTMPAGNIALRSVHSGGFLAVDAMSANLCQQSAAFDPQGKQVAPISAAFKVQPLGNGRMAMFSLTRRMYLSSQSMQTIDGFTQIYTSASAPQLDVGQLQSTSFVVQRMGVPPPPPPQGPYHTFTPPGGHAGQRKYLAFTGAIQCPTCKNVLGVDPDTTFCQCGVCKTNLNARYAQPVKLKHQYDSDGYQKKHKRKKNKQKKRKHHKDDSDDNTLIIGACVVVGGIMVADAMPAEAWEGMGDGIVMGAEFIGEGAIAGAGLIGDGAEVVGEGIVDGAGFAADGLEGLWESGVGDAMADGGEFVLDGAVEAGGFIADGAAAAGGAVADGAGAVWESGVLQTGGEAMADGAGAVGGAVADGAGAVWDSDVLQTAGGGIMEGAGFVGEGAVAGAGYVADGAAGAVGAIGDGAGDAVGVYR